MNKTININLGGLFFHIDEKAFEKLKHYLAAVSDSLIDDPNEKDEIIKDIEQRIGELLNEKITNDRQVINTTHIDEVIVVMGQPEDYAFDDELFSDIKSNSKRKRRSKRFFRDGKDRILGGVAAGTAHYFGIDISITRIIWAVLGIFTGVGVIAYIILWIILPETRSTADELEMKGEPVNIDNIEKTIKEEYAKIEDKVKNTDYSKVKSGFQDFIDTLGKLLGGFLVVIGKFIGILLLIIASVTLIALFIGLITWGGVEIFGYGESALQVPPFMEHTVFSKEVGAGLLLLTIAIPFVFLFVMGLNILSKEKKSMGITANLSLLGIWLLSVFGIGFMGIEHGTRYSKKGAISENIEYAIAKNDTLKITMIGNDKITNRESLHRSKNLETVTDSNGEEKLFSSNVYLDVRKSNSDSILLKIVKTSRSRNKQQAREKAKLMTYLYSENNNQLDLNSYFLTDPKLENNRPFVDVIVYVPLDCFVYFDNTTKSFIHDIKNKDDIYDSDMAKHLFFMSPDGLKCMDCRSDENLENENNGNDNVDIDINTKGVKFKINSNKEEDIVNLNINKKGVKLLINDGDKKAEVKIDNEGMEIK